MKMYQYHSPFQGEILHKMTEDFGESVTDKTFFRPDVSSVRSFMASPTGSNKVGQYDFADGKDTGDMYAARLRAPGLDITEIDAIGNEIKAKMERDIALQKDEKAVKADKELMAAMAASVDKIASGKGDKPDIDEEVSSK